MSSMSHAPATTARRFAALAIGLMLAVGLVACGQLPGASGRPPVTCEVQSTVQRLDAVLLEVESLDAEAIAVEGSPEQVAALGAARSPRRGARRRRGVAGQHGRGRWPRDPGALGGLVTAVQESVDQPARGHRGR